MRPPPDISHPTPKPRSALHLSQHVAYDTFDDALFDAPGIGNATALFATAQESEVARDVSDIVTSVLNDDTVFEQRAQFRMLWFLTETDGITLVASDLGLDVTYLAP